MTPKKPHWFRLADILMPGSLTFLSLLATIWVFSLDRLESATGESLPSGIFGVHGLMVAVTLGFAVVYLRLLYARWSDLKPFRYIKGPGYGVMLHSGGYEGPITDDDVIREFEGALAGWGRVLSLARVISMANQSVFWVWFRPTLTHPRMGESVKIAGHTVAGAKKIVVIYKDPKTPLRDTALRHEIGHVIQGHITGSWDQAEHHLRSSEHKLP